MKISQIIVETSTTAGVVATVSKPLGEVQSRTKVAGLEPAEKLMKGSTKKKGPYVNSISESKKKVEEAELSEDDIIIVPGHGKKLKNGFVPHGKSRVDHEVEMARSDVLATIKNAKALYELLKNRSEEEGLEGWVQEKLIKANDYLNAVKEYYDEKMMQEMAGGVIAGGGVGESSQRGDTLVTDSLRIMKGPEVNDAVRALTTVLGNREYNSRRGFYNFYIKQMIDMYNKQGVAEGAKVDRMVKHIAKSEKKLGKSKDEAENIAWATANKRGMLDNKNKKA